MGDFIALILAHALYGGLVLMLILCGLGLPIPEELTFLSAGWYGRDHGATLMGLCVCGLIGIMLGDSIPFFIGKRYGLAFLSHRWFAKILKPHHLEKAQKFFEKRGSKAILGARFLAGLRMPTFFMAGSMGVSYWTFFFWDFLGALVSCPVSIWLAFHFGRSAEEILRKSHVYVFGAIGAIVLFFVVKCLLSKKKGATEVAPPVVEQTSAARTIEAPDKAEHKPVLVPKVGAQAQK